MIAEHSAIAIKNFNGLFDRGPANSVPVDHFIDCLNVDYEVNNVYTRPGSVIDFPVVAQIARVRSYEKTGEATRYLILTTGGNLFDSTSIASPILSIVGMKDFALIVMYDRAYISPHNGDRGLPGEWLYVYDGTGVARKAAGIAPATAPTCTTATDDGFVEKGNHLIAIAYQTNSGFITKRGPATLYDAPGGKKLIVSNIPTGPTGTVARYVLSTRIIKDYNGNQQGYEYFFVPNGLISDNTSTTITVSYFDANLVSSADYLYDQLDVIPAGVYLGIFKGALLSMGEDAQPTRVRVSKPNEPESHNTIDGFLDVYPKDNGGPVRCAIEFRAQLILFKSYRSYITQDNGSNPGFWQVTALDKSVGSECNGICKVLDVDGTSNDQFLVASRAGLLIFDGSFSGSLSWKIDNIWKRINKLYHNKILVALDPINEKVYIAAPIDEATECNVILMGNYSEGMSAEKVKWAVWRFPALYVGCFVDILFATKQTVLKYANYNGNVYRVDETALADTQVVAGDVAINSYIRFYEATPDERGGINLFSGIRANIAGEGNLQVNVYSKDAVLVLTAPSINLDGANGRIRARSFLFENEKASVQIGVTNNSEWFNLKHFWIFSTPIWAERPDEE
jgi:hypothetical protein